MKWLKVGAVVFSAVLITALGIDAADTLSGSRSTLLGQVISAGDPACPEGMTGISSLESVTCIDIYEASPSKECPFPDPSNEVETQANFNEPACKPESKKSYVPWRFVSSMHAQQLCARAGKRLPTNEQWHDAVSGFLPGESCTVNIPAVQKTGAASCVTDSGVHDMVGNVWEWVDEEVVDGNFNGRSLPLSGYIASVDTHGIAIETSAAGTQLYGNDYAHIQQNGVQGMLRGGYYGNGEEAGIFAQNMAVPLSLTTAGVGFRCIK